MKQTKTTSVGLSIYGQCVLGLRKAEQYLWKNLAWTVSNVDWFCFWSNPFLVGLAVGPLPSGAVNIIKHKKTVIQCFGKETIQAKESYNWEKCTAKVEDNLREEVFLSRRMKIQYNERPDNSVYWRGPPPKYKCSANYKCSEMKE